jgi:hypothetical protein
MTKRRNALAVGIATLSLGMVPTAWAAKPGPAPPPGPGFTGHNQTVTVVCDEVPPFTADANASFGQQTQVAAFNATPQDTSCEVVGP